jgi:hypothetical protein
MDSSKADDMQETDSASFEQTCEAYRKLCLDGTAVVRQHYTKLNRLDEEAARGCWWCHVVAQMITELVLPLKTRYLDLHMQSQNGKPLIVYLEGSSQHIILSYATGKYRLYLKGR